MNKKRVTEVIDAGLSCYAFTDRHKYDLMMQLKMGKLAGKRKVYTFAIALVLFVIIVLAISIFMSNH